MSYDALGRLATDSGPDFPAEAFTYCSKGACLVAANANGRDSITYDLLGRVSSVVQQMPGGSTRDTIQYSYDSQRRLVRRQSPSGSAPLAAARWAYDATLGVLDTLCAAGACASIGRAYEVKPTSFTYQPGSGGSWSQQRRYNALHLDLTRQAQSTVAAPAEFPWAI